MHVSPTSSDFQWPTILTLWWCLLTNGSSCFCLLLRICSQTSLCSTTTDFGPHNLYGWGQLLEAPARWCCDRHSFRPQIDRKQIARRTDALCDYGFTWLPWWLECLGKNNMICLCLYRKLLHSIRLHHKVDGNSPDNLLSYSFLLHRANVYDYISTGGNLCHFVQGIMVFPHGGGGGGGGTYSFTSGGVHFVCGIGKYLDNRAVFWWIFDWKLMFQFRVWLKLVSGGIHALEFVRPTQDWLSFIIWDRPKTDQKNVLKSIPAVGFNNPSLNNFWVIIYLMRCFQRSETIHLPQMKRVEVLTQSSPFWTNLEYNSTCLIGEPRFTLGLYVSA